MLLKPSRVFLIWFFSLYGSLSFAQNIPFGFFRAPIFDDSPNAFNFTDQTAVAPSTLITSNILQIMGIQGLIDVSISGTGSPEYRICSNVTCSSVVEDWTDNVRTIQNAQYLQLRLTSSASDLTMHTATVSVGTGSDSWNVTTNDSTPNAFSFTDLTEVALSTLVTSEIVQVTGITGSVAVSIAGTGTPEYRICSNATCSTVVVNWTSSPNTIQNNQRIQLRLTSSASQGVTHDGVLTIGNGGDTWSVTTEPPDPCIGASNTTDYTTAGTFNYVVPGGVDQVVIKSYGAGGGGAKASALTSGFAGGGGGGSVVERTGTLLVAAGGGGGGGGASGFSGVSGGGGGGGYAHATVNVTTGTTLNIWVGGGGLQGTGTAFGGSGGNGGAVNGGTGSADYQAADGGSSVYGGGGGTGPYSQNGGASTYGGGGGGGAYAEAGGAGTYGGGGGGGRHGVGAGVSTHGHNGVAGDSNNGGGGGGGGGYGDYVVRGSSGGGGSGGSASKSGPGNGGGADTSGSDGKVTICTFP